MTPWQKVHAKFGCSASALAESIGRHRSKVTRALKDERGLINGKDQVLLMKAAAERGIVLELSDLLPNV